LNTGFRNTGLVVQLFVLCNLNKISSIAKRNAVLVHARSACTAYGLDTSCTFHA